MALVSLPPEILNAIIAQVTFRPDLSHLSRTCKLLKGSVFPKLYQHLVLKIPLVWNHLSHVESLIDPCGHAEGLQYTTSISIVPQINSLERTVVQGYDGTEGESSCGDITLPGRSTSFHLNTLVRTLLKMIRKQSLMSFSWEHTCFMTSTTLNILSEIFESSGIKKLRIDEFWDDLPAGHEAFFEGLESLTIKSISFNVDTLCYMIREHRETIQSLCLGAESDVLRAYHQSNSDPYLRHQPYVHELVDDLRDDGEDNEVNPWLELRELHLIGFDVDKLIEPAHKILRLQNLTSITLETCPGLERALELLATRKDKTGLFLRSTLRLESFSIRHESSNHQFRTRLFDFLGAVRGLTHLSVLLEGDGRSHITELKPMLAAHGSSLRSLVRDERSGKRNSFTTSEPVSEPSHYLIGMIAVHCPHLVELGVSMDWRDFTQKGSFWPNDYNRDSTSRAFRRLKALRTLNIRTMPFVNAKKMVLPLTEIHASFVNTLLTIISCKDGGEDVLSRSAPQHLETLALGALTYRDIRNGLGCHGIQNPDLYEFLRLKVYRIICNHHIDGRRQKPMAVLTEAGTYEKTEANGGAVNVLKPYWLG